MATEPQILANRRNAQKSTGPRTPEAKAAVAKNALKHGLTARHDVIRGENQADFDLYRDEMLDELAPVGPMETMLANRVVSLSWRLERAARIQNQTIDALNTKRPPGPLLTKLTQSILAQYGRPEPNPADSDPNLVLGRMVIKDFSNARVLEHLLLYERRIEHSLYRTMLELQRLTLIRKSHLADISREERDPQKEACHLSLLAHKVPPFMQNKANFRRADNDRNLSSNKHLRRKTTPASAKKQSQFKTNWQKDRDPCQTSPNTGYQFRATILRAYKAPLAGVPPLQAPRAHKTTPFMQNKANFPTPANEPNLSSNKRLRTQTTPSTTKKQSQFPKTPKSAQTPPAQRLTKKTPAGAEKNQTQPQTQRLTAPCISERSENSPKANARASDFTC